MIFHKNFPFFYHIKKNMLAFFSDKNSLEQQKRTKQAGFENNKKWLKYTVACKNNKNETKGELIQCMFGYN